MKKNKLVLLGGVLIGAIIVFLLFENKEFSKQRSQPLHASLPVVTLALDYAPNTNHTGIFVAQAKGWYKNAGIQLKILPVSSTVTPDVLVANKKADVGISYTEGVVTDAATGNPVVSIAAIIQHNTSSLVALADSGIKRPKDFDSKTYGGFGASYENAVVSEIIKKDGGTGTFKNVTLDTGGIQALQTHKIDFAWIFDGWEGVQASRAGIQLISFPINSNGIADYYTPVIITSSDEITKKSDVLKKFMHATSLGYTYAIDHPQESADIFFHAVSPGTFSDRGFLQASQEYLSPRYVDKGRRWGLQDQTAWHAYPQFMLDSQAITDATGKPVRSLPFDSLYTNKFIQ